MSQDNRPDPAVEVLIRGLAYPEGAFWSARDGCLYFVEWQGDRVARLHAGEGETVFRTAPGSGPCGLCQAPDGSFWVCLYSAGRVAHYGPAGRLIAAYDGWEGGRFKGPNDLVLDGQGDVIFTDSGDFADDWRTGRPAGAVYAITPEGKVSRLAADLCFPNGLALSADETVLYVNEHRKNRMLAFDRGVSGGRVFCPLDAGCLLPPERCYELGPDGMSRDERGTLWAAHYGGGKVIGVGLSGEPVRLIHLPEGRQPTNTAVSADGKTLYVTEAEKGLLLRARL